MSSYSSQSSRDRFKAITKESKRRPAENARPGGQDSETLGVTKPETAAGLKTREKMSVAAPGYETGFQSSIIPPDLGPRRVAAANGRRGSQVSAVLARGGGVPSTRPHLSSGAPWRQ